MPGQQVIRENERAVQGKEGVLVVSSSSSRGGQQDMFCSISKSRTGGSKCAVCQVREASMRLALNNQGQQNDR